MSKRLVLFSQPSPEVWDKLDEVLFPKYLGDRVFAYMPSEGDSAESNAKYTPVWQEYAQKNNARFVFVDNSKRGEEAKIEVEKILSANILMITGGNTFKLLNHLRLSGLSEATKEFWKKENVVLSGFSAGAIVLGPTIETARTGCGDVDELGLDDLTGLGIVDFEIWPHYDLDQEKEMVEYKTKNQVEIKTMGNEEVVVINK